MILYTSQVPSVARRIGNEDYHCLYCSKFDKSLNTYDLDDFCRIGYTFIANEMRNLPGHIEGAYPIWLTPNPEEAVSATVERTVLIKVDIPDEYLLLTDFDLYTVNCMVDYTTLEEKRKCLDISDSEYIQATTWVIKPEWLISKNEGIE